MGRILVRCMAILFVFAAVIWVEAQDTTNPSNQDTTNPVEQVPKAKAAKQIDLPKLPDVVCFGEGPEFRIQFVSWGARYLGVDQPDQDFRGSSFWIPERKVWLWERGNNLAPVGSRDVLSATIQKASCTDPQRGGTFPFAAVVSLPEGDMLSGCCRILKAKEAPAGPHPTPSNDTSPQ